MRARKLVHRAVGVAVVAGLTTGVSAGPAAANPGKLRALSAAWVQWALSIPAAVNPLLDETGENCMVGQRGRTWFLAGALDDKEYTRTCSVPQGKAIFLPIAHSFHPNAPGICVSVEQSVDELRGLAADIIDGVTDLEVLLDGAPVRITRLRSPVFEISMPEDNVFDAPCAPADVPEAVYSPAVAEGYYVRLPPLPLGAHTLSISSAGSVVQDVTYTLNIVPVDKD